MKNKKSLIIVLIISGVLTAGIAIAMNMFLIPEIEKAAGGLKCFDMRFGYSYEAAREFLNMLTIEGKHIYADIQLPLDFFYPVAYGVFFVLLTYVLVQKATPLFILPGLLVIADYTENICIAVMLKSSQLSEIPVRISSFATVFKTVLMYGCFLMIILLLIRRLILRKKLPD